MQYRPLVAFLLIIVTLAVFWPVHNYEFIGWDDDKWVYNNRYLTQPSIENTLHFWKEPHIGLYLPVTGTALSALASLSQKFPAEPYGLNPGLFHTANLLVHILSVLVVFGILRLLLRHGFRESKDKNDDDGVSIELAAGVGALIFAIHPVQVETVAWISELKDLLCGLFSFIAIKEYLAYAIASKSGIKGGAKNGHYAIASAALILALLSKPAAVIVPLVALILDRFAIKRDFKKSAVALIGWFIVAGVFAIVAKTVQQSGYVIVSPPLWARPFIAGDALAFYLYKLVFPLQLGIDYGRNPDYVLGQWWLYATWFVPAALLMEIWILKRRVPLLVSFGLFTASLLPVLGFTPFLFQNQSTVADHYLYIPMLGVTLCVSWLFMNLRGRPARLIVLPVIALLFIRSSLLVPTWKDELSLYTNALKVNPASFTSNNNMGILLANKGKAAEAITYYKNALNIRPGQPDVYNNLGVVLKNSGRLEAAALQFKKAIENRSGYAKAHNNLGKVLADLGKQKEAVYHFKQAALFWPDNPAPHDNLGVVLARQGNFTEAVAHFTEALKIKPDYEPARKHLEIAKKRLANR